ncbi:MAG TPA: hypothetical protein VIX19_18295 [Terriglobales bacterium]
MTSNLNLLQRSCALLLAGAALAFMGCDDTKPAPPAQPKTSQFETGRFALQKMIPAARSWSPDANPIQLTSSTNSESIGHDGKSGFWRAVFASPARGKSEPFSWSGLVDPDVPRGVNHGVEDTYSAANRSMMTWDLNYLKVDTDQAFETAQQHGGKTLLEKESKLPVTYLLDFDAMSHQLRWHVIYGTPAKLTVFVDASSGNFLRKE